MAAYIYYLKGCHLCNDASMLGKQTFHFCEYSLDNSAQGSRMQNRDSVLVAISIKQQHFSILEIHQLIVHFLNIFPSY